jgi:cell division protein FtsL
VSAPAKVARRRDTGDEARDAPPVGGRIAPSARSARLGASAPPRIAGRSAAAATNAASAAAPVVAPVRRTGPSRGRDTSANPARTGVVVRQSRKPRARAGFVVLFCAVVGSMVLGLVSLNALLAKASFRVDDLSTRIDGLEVQHLELVSEQAELSAPGRIAEWARRNGMRLPDDIRLLHAPDASGTAPAGVADASGSDR